MISKLKYLVCIVFISTTLSAFAHHPPRVRCDTVGEFLSFYVAKKGIKFGLIDRNNWKVVQDFYYDEFITADGRPFEEATYLIVRRGDKYGVINYVGKMIVPVEYAQLEMHCIESTHDYIVATDKDGKHGVFSPKGKVLAKMVYTEIVYECGEALELHADEDQVYMDKHGKIVDIRE